MNKTIEAKFVTVRLDLGWRAASKDAKVITNYVEEGFRVESSVPIGDCCIYYVLRRES